MAEEKELIQMSEMQVGFIANKLWMTNRGETLKMSDMATQHILNCITWIRNHRGIADTRRGITQSDVYFGIECIRLFEEELASRIKDNSQL